jgi:hypothetical protein
MFLNGAGMGNCLPVLDKVHGIHGIDLAAQQDFSEKSSLTPALEYRMSGR